jgi:hypothetical protein
MSKGIVYYGDLEWLRGIQPSRFYRPSRNQRRTPIVLAITAFLLIIPLLLLTAH